MRYLLILFVILTVDLQAQYACHGTEIFIDTLCSKRGHVWAGWVTPNENTILVDFRDNSTIFKPRPLHDNYGKVIRVRYCLRCGIYKMSYLKTVKWQHPRPACYDSLMVSGNPFATPYMIDRNGLRKDDRWRWKVSYGDTLIYLNSFRGKAR